MVRARGVLRARSPRAGVLRVAVPALLALVLTGCGTVPPEASPGGLRSPRPAAATSPTPARATSAAAGPTASPSPSAAPTKAAATPTPTTTTKPTTTKPTKKATKKAKPQPPPDTWVGHFRGKEVWVPRGHGATVSFTFDDGPWPGSTAQVLALLQQNHVHATFCLIGNQAKAYPSLVRREVAAGHALCDHSRDHDLAMNKKNRKHRSYVDAEVGDGLADIRRAAPKGTPVTYYRQPGGLWSPAVVTAMNRRGLSPLRWSDDPRDWSRPGSAVVVQRVVSQLHPGAVILMHDGGGDRSQSVEALRFLLRAVVAAGYKPVLPPHVKLSDKAAARPQ